MIRIFALSLMSVVFLHFSACKKKKKEEECTPPTTFSYKNDVQPIFNENCTTSGCHSGTNPAGNLNLTASVSYQNLMNSQSGYIDTLHPSSSLLYASMNSTNNPMPPNGKLSACKLELVLKWIEQRAKNN